MANETPSNEEKAVKAAENAQGVIPREQGDSFLANDLNTAKSRPQEERPDVKTESDKSDSQVDGNAGKKADQPAKKH